MMIKDERINDTMTNEQMLALSYTDMLSVTNDLTYMLAGEDDLDKFDDILALTERATIILKRLGDTVLINQVELEGDAE
jgi:hypothetical protein